MLADAGAPAVLALAPLAVVLAFLAPPPRLWSAPFQVEGAAGALGAAEGVRAAEGFAAHGAGEGAVEQRGAVGGGRHGRRHGEARACLDAR